MHTHTQKVKTERNFLNTIEDIFEKLTVNIILSGERLKAFFLRSGTWQGSLLFTTATQYCTEVLARHKKKKVKGIQIGEEKVKRSLLIGDMILYVENPCFFPGVIPSCAAAGLNSSHLIPSGFSPT